VTTPDWVSVRAPAKVNLFLEVLARRADGYHELDTLMLSVEPCDELRVRATESGAIECRVTGPLASADVPTDERNLAVRAARLVLERARQHGTATVATGLELELTKKIPSQAGLGGASSDAASAFAAAEQALRCAVPDGEAQQLLASLGSDCAFFRTAATTGLARCTGRGERVAPWPSFDHEFALLIVTPDVGASTPEVYRRLDDPLSWRDERRILLSRCNSATSAAAAPILGLEPFNRLEAAAFAAVPRLALWRDALVECARTPFWLSGSGSSFFALFDNPAAAHSARSALEPALERRALRPRGVWVSQPVRRAERSFDA